MTAEERLARFPWKQCPGGDGHDSGDDGLALMCPRCHADEFRAAEREAADEALERAAKWFEARARRLRDSAALPETDTWQAAQDEGAAGEDEAVARDLRSLKSGTISHHRWVDGRLVEVGGGAAVSVNAGATWSGGGSSREGGAR